MTMDCFMDSMLSLFTNRDHLSKDEFKKTLKRLNYLNQQEEINAYPVQLLTGGKTNTEEDFETLLLAFKCPKYVSDELQRMYQKTGVKNGDDIPLTDNKNGINDRVEVKTVPHNNEDESNDCLATAMVQESKSETENNSKDNDFFVKVTEATLKTETGRAEGDENSLIKEPDAALKPRIEKNEKDKDSSMKVKDVAAKAETKKNDDDYDDDVKLKNLKPKSENRKGDNEELEGLHDKCETKKVVNFIEENDEEDDEDSEKNQDDNNEEHVEDRITEDNGDTQYQVTRENGDSCAEKEENYDSVHEYRDQNLDTSADSPDDSVLDLSLAQGWSSEENKIRKSDIAAETNKSDPEESRGIPTEIDEEDIKDDVNTVISNPCQEKRNLYRRVSHPALNLETISEHMSAQFTKDGSYIEYGSSLDTYLGSEICSERSIKPLEEHLATNMSNNSLLSTEIESYDHDKHYNRGNEIDLDKNLGTDLNSNTLSATDTINHGDRDSVENDLEHKINDHCDDEKADVKRNGLLSIDTESYTDVSDRDIRVEENELALKTNEHIEEENLEIDVNNNSLLSKNTESYVGIEQRDNHSLEESKMEHQSILEDDNSGIGIGEDEKWTLHEDHSQRSSTSTDNNENIRPSEIRRTSYDSLSLTRRHLDYNFKERDAEYYQEATPVNSTRTVEGRRNKVEIGRHDDLDENINMDIFDIIHKMRQKTGRLITKQQKLNMKMRMRKLDASYY